MENWTDEGIILHHQRLGEQNNQIRLLSARYGVCRGFVRGNPNLTSGSIVQVEAREHNNLTKFKLELLTPIFPYIMAEPLKLMVLEQLMLLLRLALPEKMPYTQFYQQLHTWLTNTLIPGKNNLISDWFGPYLRLEVQLLQAIGFGFDYSPCPLAPQAELTHVSMRTGKGLSTTAADRYPDQVLILPEFLYHINDNLPLTNDNLRDGLRLTSFFLSKHLSLSHHSHISQLRHQLLHKLL